MNVGLIGFLLRPGTTPGQAGVIMIMNVRGVRDES